MARYGPALLPDVAALLKDTAADDKRHRLLSLRYRLLATGGLSLRWPGGMARLASPDANVRHQAVEELVELAGPDDQPLLSELFRNPDPLIREMALRALRHAGGPQATAALVTLLDDPEPNVRAAVLKQLAEEPTSLVTKVAEYAKREKDTDLVVHAIRVLKKSSGPVASKTLVELLKHTSWQVRAEAAEALGKLYDRGHGDATEEELQARLALVDLLDDSDAFVVGKALASLPPTTEATAIDRLVGVAKKHPALTTHVINKLVQSEAPHDKLLPHVRAFAGHADAAVRVAAIDGLSYVAGEDFGDDLVRALGDAEPKVRIAAADAIVSVEQRQRPKADDGSDMTHEVIPADGDVNPRPQSLTQRIISSLFGPPNPPPRKVEEKPQPDAEPAAEQKPRPKPPEPPEDFDTTRSTTGSVSAPPASIYRPGRRRLSPLVEKMLSSPAPDEQSAAAIALVALGKRKKGCPCSFQRPLPNPIRFAAPRPHWDGSCGSGGSAFMSSY